MAFLIADFAPIGGQASRGEAPALYSYWTEDAHTTIDTSGYFDSLSQVLSVGDVIMVERHATGVPAGLRWHIVASNSAGVVDVFDAFGGSPTLTDTD